MKEMKTINYNKFCNERKNNHHTCYSRPPSSQVVTTTPLKHPSLKNMTQGGLCWIKPLAHLVHKSVLTIASQLHKEAC